MTSKTDLAAEIQRLSRDLANTSARLKLLADQIESLPADHERGAAIPGPDSGPRRLLTVQETAQVLGLSRSTVFQLLRAGDLPSIQIGRRRLIPSGSIDEFISAKRALPS